MTTGLVTGFGQMQDLVQIAPAPQTSENAGSFSDALKVSTEGQKSNNQSNDVKQTSVKSQGEDAKTQQSKTLDKADKAEVKADDSQKTTEEKAVKESGTADEKDATLDSEEMEAVSEAIASVMQTVAQVLDIPVSEVEAAVEALGMEEADLLDATNVPQIVVELTDAQDTMDIMTDEKLFAQVKEITAKVNENAEDVAQALDVSIEDVTNVVKEALSSTQSMSEEVTEIGDGVEITVETGNGLANANVQNQSVAKQNEKDAGDEEAGDGKEKNNAEGAGANVTFGQSVVDGLKDAVAQVEQPNETGYSPSEMRDIIDQVQENLKLNFKEDATEMEINLHPASLGNVKVQVATRDGVITANFTTQNEEVKAAIESQLVSLKESMNEQGIKVEAIEVTVESHAFDENLSKEGERNSDESGEAKKKKIRSINLNDVSDEEDEADDEIRIAREMMMANGTTVDYLT